MRPKNMVPIEKRSHTLVAWRIDRRERRVKHTLLGVEGGVYTLDGPPGPGVWRAYCQYDKRVTMRRVMKRLRETHGRKWEYRSRRIQLTEVP